MNALTELFSTSVAQRIGWALIHFVWQGTAVALLSAVTLATLRRRSAQARWIASCAALALMAALPVATALVVTAEAPQPPEPAAAATAADRIPTPGGPAESGTGPVSPPLPELAHDPKPLEAAALSVQHAPRAHEEHTPRLSWPRQLQGAIRPALPWATGVWLAGVLAMSIWHIGGWLQVRRMRRLGARVAGAAAQERFDRVLQRLRISRPVRLLESLRVAVPVVVGWVRPVILLPVGAVAGLTPPQLEAILAHELAHIRRWDCLVQALQAMVETLLFYHPAVWWVSRQVRQEGEHCCDDLAVGLCGDRSGYAHALAQVAELGAAASRRSPGKPALAAAATGGKVLPRIRRLLGAERPAALSFGRCLSGVLALMTIAAIAVGVSWSSEDNLQKDTPHTVASVTEPAASAPGAARVQAEHAKMVRPILHSLKQDVVELGKGHPQLADAKAVEVTASGWLFERDCRNLGKRGYESTGPFPIAIGLRVMTAARFRAQAAKVEMQLPSRRWEYLGLVGWTTLHTGPDIPGALVGDLQAALRKALAKMGQLNRQALAARLPQAIQERRNRLLAEADAAIRKGVQGLADRYPLLKKGKPWDRLERPSDPGRIGIYLRRQHGGKGGTDAKPFPPLEAFSILVVVKPPPDQIESLVLTPLYRHLGLVGQVSTRAADPRLDAALKKLVSDALAPLSQLERQASALPAAPATQPAARRSSSRPQGQPVIALWNDGAHMARIKPFLLFAAWDDGTVLRRGEVAKPMGGARSLHDWAAGKLTIGSIKPSEVLALQAAMAKASFFRPPLADGVRFVDGPSQSLLVRYGKAHRLLSHHGPSDTWLGEHIGKLGPTASPTRKDTETFVAMWDHVVKLIDAIAPTNVAEFRGQREVAYPEPFDATDENGDPSVAYWGVPEYKEIKAHVGTPQCVTTMTIVQVVGREKYVELKAAGKTRNEERHGDWVYFATSGIVQIPNDTAYVELTTRYKALVPYRESTTQPAAQKAEEKPRFLTLPKSAQAMLGPMEKVGTHFVTVNDRSRRIAWYRVQADYNAIREDVVWPKVPCPKGTAAAYVGRYGKIRWSEWHGEIHRQRYADGMDFLGADKSRVGPGPGDVMIRWWLFKEEPRKDGMAFEEGRLYAFCFSRKPVADARSKPKYPACDLSAELPHLLGIIAIVPTFDFGRHPRSAPLHVTAKTLRSFLAERLYRREGRQELALTRLPDGSFRLQTSGKRSAVAPPQLVQKLLYALNTCVWRRLPAEPKLRLVPTRTTVTYEAADGGARKVTIRYDHGGWYLRDQQNRHYNTIHPYLLFEVLDDARKLCGE